MQTLVITVYISGLSDEFTLNHRLQYLKSYKCKNKDKFMLYLLHVKNEFYFAINRKNLLSEPRSQKCDQKMHTTPVHTQKAKGIYQMKNKEGKPAKKEYS